MTFVPGTGVSDPEHLAPRWPAFPGRLRRQGKPL